MSDYLSSFIIDPVVRQARRLSRISSAEEAAALLPAVPESLRTWYPTRLWNTSPPPSIDENDSQETTSQPYDVRYGPVASQLPSPPLEPVETSQAHNAPQTLENNISVTEFPLLEPEPPPQSQSRRLQPQHSLSDTSLNPLRELSSRSRLYETSTRGHSQSSPTPRLYEDVNRIHSQSDPIDTLRARHDQDVVQDNFNYDGTGSEGAGSEALDAAFTGSGMLPEDDGMGPLRQKINEIWNGPGDAQDKSSQVHALMMEKYLLAQRGLPTEAVLPSNQHNTGDGNLVKPSMLLSATSQPVRKTSRDSIEDRTKYFNLSPAGLIPTYAPLPPLEPDENGIVEEQPRQFGCQHYKRNVKMQCNACRKWYTCRLCHDEVESHVLPRSETRNMLCMICSTPQEASQSCRMCGNQSACYYCSVCKLWNNDPEKAIYHCDDCGICRLGQGLGKDFFHCKTCVVCMSITAQSAHRCIEQSTKCDCPICGEYLFTSSRSVVFMRCGHAIHEVCFRELCSTSYKCPICSKSVTNMESEFRRLDQQIASQPMPEEYQDTRTYVYCNDCTLKGMTVFHWLGLKCARCESYNTTMLGQPLNSNGQTPNIDADINIHASPSLPLNISDEAVAIPNSRAASRRPSTALSDIADTSGSPWLVPQYRGARSVSPVVGNYFGLRRESRDVTPIAALVREDEDLDFWGRTRRRRQEENEMEDEDESEDEASDMEMEDELAGDDGEEEDPMDIFGHR